MLEDEEDVEVCLSEETRSWFYVVDEPNTNGYDSRGRAYLRIRPAELRGCEKYEEPTHLIFTIGGRYNVPRIDLRDLRLKIEQSIRSMGVKICRVEATFDGKQKCVHIHTVDAESANVVKLFLRKIRECDIFMNVSFGPKASNTVAKKVITTNTTATTSRTTEKSLVLEPITESYSKFGVSYSKATAGSS